MSQPTEPDPFDDHATAPPVSRRALIGGLTAAGVIGAVATSSNTAAAAPLAPLAPPSSRTEALGSVIPGLVYVTLDALAFDVAGTAPGAYRLYQEVPATGVQPSNAPANIYAPLTLPVGSTLRQINLSCQGQPIVFISRRDFTTGAFTDVAGPFLPGLGGGVQTANFALDTALTQGGSYAVRIFCSVAQSVLGMSIGYVPPAQAFVPYTGGQPRALDTRDPGLTRFGVNEERVIDLSSRLIPTARAAVINLTAVDTGGGGFLSAYADGIAWPGNSSVNYSAAGQTVANAAVVTMTNGRIKVRAGVGSAHVVVDVVGSLL
jgi:hypothetical protein